MFSAVEFPLYCSIYYRSTDPGHLFSATARWRIATTIRSVVGLPTISGHNLNCGVPLNNTEQEIIIAVTIKRVVPIDGFDSELCHQRRWMVIGVYRTSPGEAENHASAAQGLKALESISKPHTMDSCEDASTKMMSQRISNTNGLP